jgi:sugar phosphate isomerase/epimerase
MGFYAHSIYGSSKDIETLSDSHSGTFVPIGLGDGGINYFSMLNDLKSNSKIDYFTFEDHARPEIRDEVLSKGVNYIRNIINK